MNNSQIFSDGITSGLKPTLFFLLFYSSVTSETQVIQGFEGDIPGIYYGERRQGDLTFLSKPLDKFSRFLACKIILKSYTQHKGFNK